LKFSPSKSFRLVNKAALEERERHQTMNNQLQNKLSDYFRKKKSDDVQSQSLFDKSSQDQEQRYSKYLSMTHLLSCDCNTDSLNFSLC
jgi:hypothetical protein